MHDGTHEESSQDIPKGGELGADLSTPAPGRPLDWRSTQPGVSLRLATADDRAELSALIAQSARQLSRAYYSEQEIEAAVRYIFGVDSQLIVDGTYFVAHLAGRAVACGGWSARLSLYGGDQHRTASQRRLDPATEAARIRAFFVAPEVARQGVGRLLLGACAQAAQAAGFAALELVATLPGVPFYRALGFVAQEELVETLPDGTRLRLLRMTRASMT